MLKAGITGGIGSGKSIVCQVFATLGIPVFNADAAARYVMENDQTLVLQIKALLGTEVYAGNSLDRQKVSSAIFHDPLKLQQLNDLVHPVTRHYATTWMEKQSSPYVIKEAAIFFERGTYKDMDVMIGVYAPLELRISRAIGRGHQTREQAVKIASQQMDEDEKMKRCDHIIYNNEGQALIPQVMAMHQLLLSKAKLC
jgi:dephospho-CoA kinase